MRKLSRTPSTRESSRGFFHLTAVHYPKTPYGSNEIETILMNNKTNLFNSETGYNKIKDNLSEEYFKSDNQSDV